MNGKLRYDLNSFKGDDYWKEGRFHPFPSRIRKYDEAQQEDEAVGGESGKGERKEGIPEILKSKLHNSPNCLLNGRLFLESPKIPLHGISGLFQSRVSNQSAIFFFF